MDDVGVISFNKSLCITGQKIHGVDLSDNDIEDQRRWILSVSNICILLN